MKNELFFYIKVPGTLANYLKDVEDGLLFNYLDNYSLAGVSYLSFLKNFEDRGLKNPEDVAKFILDENNSYELTEYGYRASNAFSTRNSFYIESNNNEKAYFDDDAETFVSEDFDDIRASLRSRRRK